MIQEKDVAVHPSIEMLRRFYAYQEHEILIVWKILTFYSPKYAVILKIIMVTQKYLYVVQAFRHCLYAEEYKILKQRYWSGKF